ncbi:unnamed protein product [Schistosoma intercalatum]|nr:unnamed protein product [Schistosoma intercalatum]
MKFMNIITILFLFGIFISIHGYPDYRGLVNNYNNRKVVGYGDFSAVYLKVSDFSAQSQLSWAGFPVKI